MGGHCGLSTLYLLGSQAEQAKFARRRPEPRPSDRLETWSRALSSPLPSSLEENGTPLLWRDTMPLLVGRPGLKRW